jgi:hypothetical protein
MPGKASFDDIYDRPDPRAYLRTLSGLNYRTPEHAFQDGTPEAALAVVFRPELVEEGDAHLLDPVSQLREHRRQHGGRGEHHRKDRQGDRNGDPQVEGADEDEAEQGDDGGRPGEDDRSSRGGPRCDDRVARFPALGQTGGVVLPADVVQEIDLLPGHPANSLT